MEDKCRQFIGEKTGPTENLFGDSTEDQLNNFVAGINNTQIQITGPELIFCNLHDKIGYGQIDNEMFRHMAIMEVHPANA